VGGNGEAKARSKDEVLAGIARAREQITWSAQALRTEVATRMDWREQVRRNPLWFVAGAFTVGLWLGLRRR
jgi:hypothetical protein